MREQVKKLMDKMFEDGQDSYTIGDLEYELDNTYNMTLTAEEYSALDRKWNDITDAFEINLIKSTQTLLRPRELRALLFFIIEEKLTLEDAYLGSFWTRKDCFLDGVVEAEYMEQMSEADYHNIELEFYGKTVDYYQLREIEERGGYLATLVKAHPCYKSPAEMILEAIKQA